MAKQMTADEESILKRQARRRLIGAIALTTAVVIILPIVFDGEPPATTVSDIELRIPDKDKVVDLQAGGAASAVSVASAVEAASASASAPVSTTSVALPAVATAAIIAAPVVAAVATQHSAEGKAAQLEVAAAKPAQPEPKVEAKPKAEVPPKAETKPAVNNHAVPHSGFAVQVGAFANAAAAKKLQDKLTAQGLHAYTEKVGHNVRVRVGSFPSRDAADKVRRKLGSQGLHPNVVSLGN